VRRSRRAADLLVLAGYTAVSSAYFGVRLLPHPGRELVGSGRDPEIFVWSIAWWRHALLHGQNPFVTHAIWAPDGVNLAWTATAPAVGVALAPLTSLVGPAAAYNAAAVAFPALAAWTAFLLCRRVAGRLWPSVAGGYLFGFSSYVLGQQFGHLHMTAVLLVPVVALLVLRCFEGELDGIGVAWRLGLVLGLQAWLATELLLTVTLALAVALLLAAVLVPGCRVRLRSGLVAIAGAYLLAGAVAAPLLAYALTDLEHDPVNDPRAFSADLLNFALPTQATAIGGGAAAGVASRFPGNLAEQGAYVGMPALAIVGWFAVAGRHRPSARFLVAGAAVASVAALGTALWVGGRHVVALPWALVARLPLLEHVLPVRLTVFAWLAIAVVVAAWAASPAPAAWVRATLTVAAVVAVAPALWRPWWVVQPERPAFFAQRALVRACLAPGENVLIFPYGVQGDSMLWQAENDFYFRMAGGYVRPSPPVSFAYFRAVPKALSGAGASLDEILLLAHAKRVSRILSVAQYVPPRADELNGRAGPVQELGGVYVAPACGHRGIAG
jgi:hypothetical protein